MATYQYITHTVVPSSTSSVTITNIPQTYDDLVIIINGKRPSGGTADIAFQFNGDTGSNYGRERILGNGSTGSASNEANSTQANVGVLTSATQSTGIFHILQYRNASMYKSIIGKSVAPTEYVKLAVGTYRSIAPIDSIKILNGNYDTGTVIAVFGLRAGQ